MRLTKAAVGALEQLPQDGGWMTLTSGSRALFRPLGVSLAVWDRVLMGRVPDSFWKPEFDEGDGHAGRAWVVFGDIKTDRNGSRTRQYRLTRAGISLMTHHARGGSLPRQEG